ncbi:ATP-binding protein, partial [Lactobacillus crispatus]
QKTGIDIDFYVPASKIAIQVAWEVNDTSKEREVGNLIKLADNFDEVENLIIVTHGEEAEIQQEDKIIQLMPLYKFLLMR